MDLHVCEVKNVCSLYFKDREKNPHKQKKRHNVPLNRPVRMLDSQFEVFAGLNLLSLPFFFFALRGAINQWSELFRK